MSREPAHLTMITSGPELKKLRLDAGLSQLDLAKRLNRLRSWVSQVECDRIEVTYSVVKRWKAAIKL